MEEWDVLYQLSQQQLILEDNEAMLSENHENISLNLILDPAKVIINYKETKMAYSGFPGSSVVKNLPAMQETWVLSLGWEDPLEKKMATHSSILAYETPRTEEPGGLQSIESQKKVRCDLTTKQQRHIQKSKDSNILPLSHSFSK